MIVLTKSNIFFIALVLLVILLFISLEPENNVQQTNSLVKADEAIIKEADKTTTTSTDKPTSKDPRLPANFPVFVEQPKRNSNALEVIQSTDALIAKTDTIIENLDLTNTPKTDTTNLAEQSVLQQKIQNLQQSINQLKAQ